VYKVDMMLTGSKLWGINL